MLDEGKADQGVDLDGDAIAEGGSSFETHLVSRKERAGCENVL
jgi:hypothetical protein